MNRKRGMTLLEVLVALVIFATAAIAVMRTVTQHINTLSALEQKTFASIVADNQLALALLQPELRAQQGETDLAGYHWFYRVELQPTTGSLLQAFDVSVATEKGGTPVVTVRSYVEK